MDHCLTQNRSLRLPMIRSIFAQEYREWERNTECGRKLEWIHKQTETTKTEHVALFVSINYLFGSSMEIVEENALWLLTMEVINEDLEVTKNWSTRRYAFTIDFYLWGENSQIWNILDWFLALLNFFDKLLAGELVFV